MARKRKPLAPAVLAADRLAIRAILAMPDYHPANPAYSAAALQQLDATWTYAEQAEANAQQALDQAREALIDTGYTAHDIACHARAQVIVQYGDDSPNVQLVGLTRRSDYRRPGRRKPGES